MTTHLLYLDHMHDYTAEATVERVEQLDGRSVVYIDQTIMYPQGGGQPYDTGTLTGSDATFIVEEVRFVDGDVRHIGHFEGQPFLQGEPIQIAVDSDRRVLNARLHSAGHLVDMAVSRLRPDWIPYKGYHFPDGPKVEYDGELTETERDELLQSIASSANGIISEDPLVGCRFVAKAELASLCRHVPDTLPTNKPIRIVTFGEFAVPCGGTHVASLKELQQLEITKLKRKDGHISVGYDIPRPETI